MMTTLNTSVFTQTSAFIASPTSDRANAVSNGLWVRGIGGQTTVTSNASSNGFWGTYADTSRSRTLFGGVQVGLDTGLLNLNASGLNAHFGVTGGYVGAEATERLGGDRMKFEVPFIGVYGAFYYGNMVADFQIRRDFYNIDWNSALTGPGVKTSGGAWNLSGSLGYRFEVGSIFIEPSIGIDHSRLSVDNTAVPGGGPFFVPAGVYRFNDIDSTIGRAGVRLRTIVDMGNDFFLQPFAIVSVNHEFAGKSSFSYLAPGFEPAIPVEVDRIRTFGQFSLGFAALKLNSGVTAYVRADLRAGKNISGQSVSAALRYQF